MQSSPKQDVDNAVFFGPFKLAADERLLERDGVAVPIGARALDLLILLVEQAGSIVSQRLLLERVWPNIAVAESALRVHINKLRKTLGEGSDGARYIQNVAGRGYCFVAPLRRRAKTANKWSGDETRWEPQTSLPARPTRFFGRDSVVQQIAADLLNYHLVTIIGPGGVGKTTVASAACHQAADAFDRRVIFVDLGSVEDPKLVLTAIRSALNLPTSTDPATGLISALKDLRLLLVLDCCEHVVDEVASLVSWILAGAPQTHVMATSREPLNTADERVYNLPPLDFPLVTSGATAADVLEFPAVRLFMECVVARQPDFQLRDSDAAIVASICSRVDGIALALELAAGRVSAFGLTEVDRLLGGRMQLLWQGRRTAPARQQTLYATLDWSYRLLTFKKQLLLSRLSIFVGNFTLEDAVSVVADDMLDVNEIYQLLASLVDRSLLTVNTSETVPYYRLLDVNRQFAKDKIETLGDLNRLVRRHAAHFVRLLESSRDCDVDQEVEKQSVRDASRLSNVRSALEWCFASTDDLDVEIGMSLVAASSGFLLSHGLLAECKKWVGVALSHIEKRHSGTALELELLVAHASTHTLADYDVRVAALERGLEIARQLGDRRRIMTLLFQRRYDQALWGEPEIALREALQARKNLGKEDGPAEIAIAEATIACIYSTYGRDLASHEHFELAFSHLASAAPDMKYTIDAASLRRMRVSHANNLHSCGCFDRAATIGQEFIDELATSNDYLAAARTLVPIAFIFEWQDDWNKVAQIYELHERICAGQPRNGILVPYSIMMCKLMINAGEAGRALPILMAHLAETPLLSPARLIIFTPLAKALSKARRFDEALKVIGDGIDYEATFVSTGFRAEYLSCKAEILGASGTAQLSEIEEVLRLALAAAKRQTSLSRELNAATCLAANLFEQHREQEALSILKPIYARFTEGFATPPLREAQRLLRLLGDDGTS